jgi:5-methylcytosine-specific restriction endonuclease McrA
VVVGRRWQLVEQRDRLTPKQVKELFIRQDGRCPECGQELQVKGHIPVEFIDEHVEPLWRGGSNELKNRALYCKPCAGDKTSAEATQRAKSNKVQLKYMGIKKERRSGFSKRFSKRMDGTVIDNLTGKPVGKRR